MSARKLIIWLLSRVFLCLVFTSTIQKDLFIPFLDDPNLNFLDPWTSWLDSDGRPDAFPYGYVMFLFFVPAILISRFLEIGLIHLDFGILLASSLLVMEFFLFKLLKLLLPLPVAT